MAVDESGRAGRAAPRWRRIVWRIVLATASLLVALIVLLAISVGPVGAARLIRHGDTTIGDHAIYPGRTFPPSASPRPWPTDPIADPSVTHPASGERMPLTDLLTETETVAMVVIVDGVLRYQWYGAEHGPDEISQIFSVSKSVISLMMGAAIEDGLFDGTDQPITDLPITDLIRELEPDMGHVTVRDLLTMTSGTDYVEDDNPFGVHVRFNFTDHLEDAIVAIRSAEPPGTFQYRSGDNALLALALDRRLGEQSLTEYFWDALWSPIGAEHGGIWSTDRDDGLERSWCCLAVTAPDLARLGQLVLDRGRWDGQQVIPADWVAVSTGGDIVAQADLPDWFVDGPFHSYSYQWWIPSPDGTDVAGLGKNVQLLYIDRDSRAVVVRLGWTDGDLGSEDWIDLGSQVVDQTSRG